MARDDDGQDRGVGRYGPFKIGLLALHDRAFFERLISSPREAVEAEVERRNLGLNQDEIAYVVAQVEASTRGHSLDDLVGAWDRFDDDGDWDVLWPERFLW